MHFPAAFAARETGMVDNLGTKQPNGKLRPQLSAVASSGVVASAKEQLVCLTSLREGELLQTLRSKKGCVTALCWLDGVTTADSTPSASMLVTGDDKGEVAVWDVAQACEVALLTPKKKPMLGAAVRSIRQLPSMTARAPLLAVLHDHGHVSIVAVTCASVWSPVPSGAEATAPPADKNTDSGRNIQQLLRQAVSTAEERDTVASSTSEGNSFPLQLHVICSAAVTAAKNIVLHESRENVLAVQCEQSVQVFKLDFEDAQDASASSANLTLHVKLNTSSSHSSSLAATPQEHSLLSVRSDDTDASQSIHDVVFSTTFPELLFLAHGTTISVYDWEFRCVVEHLLLWNNSDTQFLCLFGVFAPAFDDRACALPPHQLPMGSLQRNDRNSDQPSKSTHWSSPGSATLPVLFSFGSDLRLTAWYYSPEEPRSDASDSVSASSGRFKSVSCDARGYRVPSRTILSVAQVPNSMNEFVAVLGEGSVLTWRFCLRSREFSLVAVFECPLQDPRKIVPSGSHRMCVACEAGKVVSLCTAKVRPENTVPGTACASLSDARPQSQQCVPEATPYLVTSGTAISHIASSTAAAPRRSNHAQTEEVGEEEEVVWLCSTRSVGRKRFVEIVSFDLTYGALKTVLRTARKTEDHIVNMFELDPVVSTYLLLGFVNGGFEVYNVKSKELLYVQPPYRYQTICWGPLGSKIFTPLDGAIIAAFRDNTSVEFFIVENEKLLLQDHRFSASSASLGTHSSNQLMGARFCPVSPVALVISYDEPPAVLRGFERRSLVASHLSQFDANCQVESIAMAPQSNEGDPCLAAIVFHDGCVGIWDLKTRRRRVLQQLYCVALCWTSMDDEGMLCLVSRKLGVLTLKSDLVVHSAPVAPLSSRLQQLLKGSTQEQAVNAVVGMLPGNVARDLRVLLELSSGVAGSSGDEHEASAQTGEIDIMAALVESFRKSFAAPPSACACLDAAALFGDKEDQMLWDALSASMNKDGHNASGTTPCRNNDGRNKEVHRMLSWSTLRLLVECEPCAWRPQCWRHPLSELVRSRESLARQKMCLQILRRKALVQSRHLNEEESRIKVATGFVACGCFEEAAATLLQTHPGAACFNHCSALACVVAAAASREHTPPHEHHHVDSSSSSLDSSAVAGNGKRNGDTDNDERAAESSRREDENENLFLLIVKRAAVLHLASGNVTPSMLLFALIDEFYEACVALQSKGRWLDAAVLAHYSSILSEDAVTELHVRYVYHLVNTKKAAPTACAAVLACRGQRFLALRLLQQCGYERASACVARWLKSTSTSGQGDTIRSFRPNSPRCSATDIVARCERDGAALLSMLFK